ncbi:MAG: NAD(P)/FAD-dependent oxidoreductase [Sphingomonadales bacterium]|nr:NAD(P)/FAD-dependent oxidoreductase [Sphingomonadales bacterium]
MATTAAKPGIRTIIVGAGMSGMLTAIKLLEKGDTNFVIYEKGDAVGGTWRENTYPGLACDTPAHSYTYSFAYNPEWSAFYATGTEIRAYFEGIATRYGLRPYIRFNTEIASAAWDGKRWAIRTKAGDSDAGEILVMATGVLHVPHVADIPGLSDFAGPWFHSARWDHTVPLKGKRVGVIGSGSTGVQIVSALVQDGVEVVHFQRTPQWIMPANAARYSDADKAAFRADPTLIENVRNGPDAFARRNRFTQAIIDVDSPELAEIQAIVEKNFEESVHDPVLKEKLRPNYRAACKRMIFSHEYYDAIQQPNAVLENGAIDRVEAGGVRMKDGTFHELDVIAVCTGFNVGAFMRPMTITGEGGVELDAVWAHGPHAYYAVTMPGFPNMLLYQGPTGPVGNFSLTDIAEHQWRYFDQLVDLVRNGQCAGFAPTQAALDDYMARRNERAKRTVFASGCKSWYLDADGIPAVWPWSFDHFAEVMAKPKLDDYTLSPA